MSFFAILVIIAIGIALFCIFPIGVELPKPRRHFVVDAIISVNIIVFIAMLLRGEYMNFDHFANVAFEPGIDESVREFFYDWGLKPSELSFSRLVTSMFVHAGVLHLFANMYLLYIFGLPVEKRLGPMAFLLLYLFGGFAADFLYVYVTSPTLESSIPLVGASGALFAVMGAFVAHFPRAKIRVFYSILIIVRGVRSVTAVVFLTLYFIFEVVKSLGIFSHGSNVAHAAHVGGFFFGLFAAYVALQVRRLRPEDLEDEIRRILEDDSTQFPISRSPAEQKTMALMKENITQILVNPDYPPLVKEQGLEGYHRLIAEFPEAALGPGPQFIIARILLDKGRWEEALEAFKKFCITFPQDVRRDEALYQIGHIYCDKFDETERATKILTLVAGEFPESPWARAAEMKLDSISR